MLKSVNLCRFHVSRMSHITERPKYVSKQYQKSLEFYEFIYSLHIEYCILIVCSAFMAIVEVRVCACKYARQRLNIWTFRAARDISTCCKAFGSKQSFPSDTQKTVSLDFENE